MSVLILTLPSDFSMPLGNDHKSSAGPPSPPGLVCSNLLFRTVLPLAVLTLAITPAFVFFPVLREAAKREIRFGIGLCQLRDAADHLMIHPLAAGAEA